METGYSITTWRMALRCRHPEWLGDTEVIYRKICLFYYQVIREQNLLEHGGSMQQLQREAERLTIKGRNGETPLYVLPFDNIPAYFRRSAINKALAAAKSQRARDDTGEMEKMDASVTFFKGTYRNMTERGVELKVWNGEKWTWMHCRLKGKPFPEKGQIMSPALVKKHGSYMLHVPVKKEISDVRPARERVNAGERICSVQFTNTDHFAVGCVLDREGSLLKVRFFGGGGEYRHRCRLLEERIQRSNESMGHVSEGQANKKYYMHLKHLAEYYGHLTSRRIVDFCTEWQVKTIVLPEYEENYSRIVQIRAGNYSPLHLAGRIRSYLSYKAWDAGMIVMRVPAAGTSGNCFRCGLKVKRRENCVICENGHRELRFVNTGVNLGRKYLMSMKTGTGKGLDKK